MFLNDPQSRCVARRFSYPTSPFLLLFLSILFFLITATSSVADTYRWVGATDSSWSTTTNWQWGSTFPTSPDTAILDGAGVAPVIGSGTSAATSLLVVNNTGTLTVNGTFASTEALIGNNTSAPGGTVTVTGGTASWTNSGNLYVGNYSTGNLNVAAGATVSAVNASVGAENGSTGTLDLTGSSTTLTLTGALHVGQVGTGILNVGNNAKLTSTSAAVGELSGATGTVTIDGGIWDNSAGALTVGAAGQGTLTLKNGGTLSNTSASIGAAAGSTSSVTVETGSTWTNAGMLAVGAYGNGTLDVRSGGTVSSIGGVIARYSGSTSTATISGTNSKWNLTGDLRVGGDVTDAANPGGTGTLQILSAGTVSSVNGFLGDSVGATGTATVDGAGSAWTISNRIGVGNYGTGTLLVQNGGVVTSAGGIVGWNASSTGSTVTVTGSGSKWDSSTGIIFIGNLGQGSLTVSNGGVVTSTDGYVGTEAVAGNLQSTATITGANSAWNNSGDLFIGHNGNGKISILNGGVVTSLQGLLGDLAGSSGTAVIDGAGSKWTTTGDFNVGRFGSGDLTLSNGGVLNTFRGIIGNEAGSTGMARVSGVGTTWADTGTGIYVGLSGTGRLEVSDGAAVTANYLYVGHDTGSAGSVLLTGAGTKLTTALATYIGSDSNLLSGSAVTITDGAVLETVGSGLYVQSNSTLTISGNGTKVLVGTLHPGTPATWTDADGWFYLNNATVNVSNGARVETDGLYVSGAPSGSATMTVTGPGTVLDGKLLIYVGGDGNDSGTTGDGSLTIANGATATATIVSIGNDTGLTGRLLVTGAGSSLTTVPNVNYAGNMYAGYTSNGIITVQDGASITAAGALRVGWADGSRGTVKIESGATLTSHDTVIGNEAGATGTVTVTGAGTLTNGDEIVVGWSGIGGMTVEAGGTVINAHEGTVGFQAGSTGTVTVTGPGSTWTNGSELVIGWSGTGAMTIANGGTVSNTNGFIGARAGGSGTVIVTGSGSTWESSSQLILGLEASTGELTIENGGKVINTGGRIGLSANSTGTVTVTGANSTLTDNGNILRVGYDGTGTLTITDGGLVTVGTATSGAYDGTLTIASNTGSTGTLNFGAAAGSSAAAAGTLKAASVVFGSGTGEIVFNHTSTGLTFDPAISGNGTVNNVAGTTILTGNNTYTGGTIISGGTVSISSDANLGGSLAVLTLNGGTLATTADITSSRDVVLGSGGGTISTASGTTLTLNGIVSGTGSLTKTGNGTLLLNAVNTYTGATYIQAGTLTLGGSNAARDISYDGPITGEGQVVKTGSGMIVLNSTGNTYSGQTTISEGIVRAGVANSFSPNSTVVLDNVAGATLDLNNFNQTIAGLSGGGTTGGFVTLGSGTLTVAQTTDATYAGVISGTGGLILTGSGTLSLTGNNTYTGATVIQAGTLSLAGANASTSISIASGAVLNFNPSQSVSYAGTITGAGPVTKTGTGTLTLTGTNTYTGGTTRSAGTIAIASDANLGDSSGALAFGGGTLQTTAALSTSRPMTVNAGGGTLDNSGNAVSLSGTLTGSGNLTLAGSGTDTLGATFAGSSYSGTATLSAGTLQLTSGASLGGTLALNAGATLTGVGTVNNLTNSGTVAPGTSTGTITVNGNFSQSGSGLYQCDLTPTGGDLISVAGSASLNGSLAIQPQYTYYASGTVWTILSATGGVTGTYSSSVTYGDTPEHWVFVPVYTSNAVTVTLQRQSYSSSATTASTAAVGSSLDAVAYSATGSMATLITALDYSPAPLTEYSLKVLNAQVYDAFTQSAFQAGRTLTTVQRAGLHGVMDPAAGAFANARDIGPGALSALDGVNAVENGSGLNSGDTAVPLGQFGVFLKTVGLQATQQGASDQVGYNSLLGGITGGLVYRPTEHLTLGLAPGFMSQGLTLHNVGGGQGTIQDWSLALLGGYAQDAWHIDGVIRGGYDAYVSQRSLPLPIGSYTAKGNWNGWNAQVAVGGGYDFTAGPVTFGPIASVEWQHLHEDSFQETGAGSLGQSLRSRDGASLNTTLGGRVSRPFETERGTITPELRAAWGAQWLGKSQHITAAFLGNPLSAYTAKTADQGYHSLLLDAGVSMRMSQSLSGSIRGGVELFRPGYASQAVSVGLKYTF